MNPTWAVNIFWESVTTRWRSAGDAGDRPYDLAPPIRFEIPCPLNLASLALLLRWSHTGWNRMETGTGRVPGRRLPNMPMLGMRQVLLPIRLIRGEDDSHAR